MVWKYRGVWLLVLIFAIVWWNYLPETETVVEQDVPPPLEGAIQWECATWHDEIPMNGHLLTLERCAVRQAERWTLYYENEILAREWYWSGVYQAGIVNPELIKKLSKPKPTTTMFREDI